MTAALSLAPLSAKALSISDTIPAPLRPELSRVLSLVDALPARDALDGYRCIVVDHADGGTREEDFFLGELLAKTEADLTDVLEVVS